MRGERVITTQYMFMEIVQGKTPRKHLLVFALVMVSIVVRKQHSYNNSYKENLLIRTGLQIHRLTPCSSWRDMVACVPTWC